jgi:hypothetical protein
MSAIQVAQRYFDAWNQRDAAAIIAILAPGGTYSDPEAGHRLSGGAIATYATGLWTAFPDLCFEIVSAADTGNGLIAAQWVMRGTNSARSEGGRRPGGGPLRRRKADFRW